MCKVFTNPFYQDKTDAESCKGSEASAKSGLGSDASSLEEKPVKSDKDLTIYEILERRAATQTVIDILKDEEDFKVSHPTISLLYIQGTTFIILIFLTKETCQGCGH